MDLYPEDFFALHSWAKVIVARENLQLLDMLDYPHLSAKDRNQIRKGLFKAANPKIINEEERPLTTEDMASILGG